MGEAELKGNKAFGIRQLFHRKKCLLEKNICGQRNDKLFKNGCWPSFQGTSFSQIEIHFIRSLKNNLFTQINPNGAYSVTHLKMLRGNHGSVVTMKCLIKMVITFVLSMSCSVGMPYFPLTSVLFVYIGDKGE